ELPFGALRLGDVVELALAIKAAVGRIGHVARVGHLVRLHDAVRGADLARELHGFVELARRKRWRHGGHTNCAMTELARGDRQDESTVNAARITDERRSHRPYSRRELLELRVD